VEKPMIKRIDFKGNKKISASKLRDTITLKENDALDKSKLGADVDKIVNHYKDEGFAAAQVEPFTTSDPTNHVTITFYITEGTQVLVQDVQLQGVTAFKLKKNQEVNENSPQESVQAGNAD
jgi:outer membrane protein insertion porin family